MIGKHLPRLLGFTLILLILLSVMNAAAAGIVVPTTRIDDQRTAISVDDLAPPSCASISLTNLVTGSGWIFGTNGNDLIVTSSAGDLIFGFDGNDCIVSGGSADTIFAGNGNDVCIGGPGADTFYQCETQNQ